MTAIELTACVQYNRDRHSKRLIMYDYFNQLKDKADAKNLDLRQMFILAGVPDSTYYRAKNGTDISRSTANKVYIAIEEEEVEEHAQHHSKEG